MDLESDTNNGFNILELYSGIGGFHFALKRKFFRPNKQIFLTLYFDD